MRKSPKSNQLTIIFAPLTLMTVMTIMTVMTLKSVLTVVSVKSVMTVDMQGLQPGLGERGVR